MKKFTNKDLLVIGKISYLFGFMKGCLEPDMAKSINADKEIDSVLDLLIKHLGEK